MKKNKIYVIMIILILIMLIFANISSVQAKEFDKAIRSTQEFTNNSKSNIINYQNLYTVINFLYNVAMTIGIIVAIVWGIIIGMRMIFGSIDERADSRNLLIPYLVSVAIIAFGAVIWKIALQLIYNKIQ